MFPLKPEFQVLEYLTTDVQSLDLTHDTVVIIVQLQYIAVDHGCVSPTLDDFTEKHLPPHLFLCFCCPFLYAPKVFWLIFISSLTITLLTRVFLSPIYSKLTQNTLSTCKKLFPCSMRSWIKDQKHVTHSYFSSTAICGKWLRKWETAALLSFTKY